MQWVLGRLKGRLGVAVVLASVVLIAVGIGRALGGSDSGSTIARIGPPDARTTPAVVSSAENDGVEGGPSVRPREPSLSSRAAPPVKVADQFIQAWLRSQLSPEQWHAGIARYATPALAKKLSGVDPAGVPAERTTGEAELIPRGAGTAAVSVPVDSGTVELRMVVVDGRWLVDGVDWSRE
jgi:hypothetical protein